MCGTLPPTKVTALKIGQKEFTTSNLRYQKVLVEQVRYALMIEDHKVACVHRKYLRLLSLYSTFSRRWVISFN